MKTAFFVTIFTALAYSVHAASNTKTVCTHGDSQRIIEVIYTGTNEVPCAVHYTKSTGTETPWQAQAELEYCEDKAAALIAKHVGWGWQCTEIANP